MTRRIAPALGLVALVALVALVGVGAAAQAPTLVIRRAGPGRPGQRVRDALAVAHDLVVALDTAVTLRGDTLAPRPVVVLGGTATVEGAVHGDVLVIDGDLILHPGAVVDGRAIAVGGCVYASVLATVRGGTECFRDAHFSVSRTGGGYALEYRAARRVERSGWVLPLAYGVRLPEYNRVDGLVVPWGPEVGVDGGRLRIAPALTYRSELGALDPSVTLRAGLRGGWGELRAARVTRSNDRWISSDLPNSLSALVRGNDIRNYYRADGASGRLGVTIDGDGADGEAWVGAATERAWSVDAGGPWSLFGRRDRRAGMLRQNPRIRSGRVTSALAGARGGWRMEDVELDGGLAVERALDAPAGRRFTQATLDAAIGFPTFGDQRLVVVAHVVATGGGVAPPQRFAYVGGSGTLPTRDPLSLGGDRLLYIDGRYDVPIERWRLPIVGPPVVSLRDIIGGAGIGRLPELVQNVGIRLSVTLLRLEFLVEPGRGRTDFSAGVALTR
jgi:hypothetical protein